MWRDEAFLGAQRRIVKEENRRFWICGFIEEFKKDAQRLGSEIGAT